MARVLELDERTIADALAVMRYGSVPHGYIREYAAGRIRYDLGRREVYSYGAHFPLFRYVPRAVSGAPDLYVINGDEWRGSRSRTRDHQAIARHWIELTCARSIVLPFSALDGAGIELDSVRALAVEPDRWVEIEREARSLAELPRHERRDSYSYTHCRATVERLPADARTEWRTPLDSELPEDEREQYRYGRQMPRLPGADGLYRYKERRYRDRAPGADGLYHWSTSAHILGESVFSAVRAESITRPADPFESELETPRATVELMDDGGRRYCTGAHGATDTRAHEAGPAAACIYCASALTVRETIRRRARFVSSFDTNEQPALYFLAQLPRGAPVDSVAAAVDALAPAAVHAALARGREVARQGDIFFIDTDLSREELAARGAMFARRTLWTRMAAPRRGEYGYRPALGAAARRRAAALENRYARRLFRRARLAAPPAAYPETGADGRVQATRARRLALESMETARVGLRRAILSGPTNLSVHASYRADARAWRHAHLSRVALARRGYDGAAARERAGRLTRAAGARDSYRAGTGSNALYLWRDCLAAAADRYRPLERFDTAAWQARRERTRSAVSIYGTAHAATESARIGGAMYVRGTVSHEPDLERGRNGGRDHRPLPLTPDRWYLAVRNAVPRQSRRRRRRPHAPDARIES